MHVGYGNITATETGGGLKIIPCIIRGETRWKLETTTGGQRRRQYFQDESEALSALKAAEKDERDLGRAWGALSPRERVEIMTTLQEVRQAGLSLPEVWTLAQTVRTTQAARCSLEDAVKELLEVKQCAGRSKRHLKNLRWYLETFIRGREKADVRSIGEAELTAWFAGRKEAPRSRRGHTGLLSALFAHCWRKRYVLENPVTRLEKVKVDHTMPAILTHRQVVKCLAWAKRRQPEFLPWIVLTLLLGLRPDSEADAITWEDIDLERGRIVLLKSKVRSFRIMDIGFCPPALEWLKVAKAAGAPLPVAKMTRRRYIRKLREFLKLSRWPQDVARHTAASNLLAYHQDAGKVAKFLGTSAGVLLRSYQALVFKEDAAKFMQIMPKNLKLGNCSKKQTDP